MAKREMFMITDDAPVEATNCFCGECIDELIASDPGLDKARHARLINDGAGDEECESCGYQEGE